MTLILSMLKVGGWAGVIVPEGVLFGSTNAHKELRRRLLLDNYLKAVISLPAGVFQPYTGVKTSILVFQKINERCNVGMIPQTSDVWFYEVAADGYTLDARRNPQRELNDLWDALEKWRNTSLPANDYYQPDIFPVRWRFVDDETISIFAETHPEISHEKDHTRGIHELFREFAAMPDPEIIKQKIIADEQPRIYSLYQQCLDACEHRLARKPGTQKELRTVLEDAIKGLHRQFEDAKRKLLESGKGLPEFARKALDPLQTEARNAAEESIKERLERISNAIGLFAPQTVNGNSVNTLLRSEEITAIVRSFARLDGYDVYLRTNHVSKKRELSKPKYWIVPVRVFARNARSDEWLSEDGKLQGGHDEQGNVRAEYIADPALYNIDGTVKKDYLDHSCIEYNDFNLSAGRYKPFAASAVTYDPPAQIIRVLQTLEQQIQEGLSTLLAMVEGGE